MLSSSPIRMMQQSEQYSVLHHDHSACKLSELKKKTTIIKMSFK